jgi:hypothetical protein
MDTEAGKKLLELESTLAAVRLHGALSDTDRRAIEVNLSSGDPVLVSLAACIIAESKGEEANLCARAEGVLKSAEAMPQAFIRLMLTTKKVADKNPAQKTASIEPLLKDTNPYLRVEAAKQLLRTDPRKGEEALKTLLSDDSIIAKGEAFRHLHERGKAANAVPVPMPDERYELLLSIIEKTDGK